MTFFQNGSRAPFETGGGSIFPGYERKSIPARITGTKRAGGTSE